ncbi:hypothetical protein QFC19_002869 [Naganishia cerealis]|uniref:Uncharacterized protein n=1 Tax=Naganishia cerealis TaxID=610337 RepID=A0ACC2W6E7_9TREE|nr:hypothetical protein QFC19_002869 [Naganishia cerealis]
MSQFETESTHGGHKAEVELYEQGVKEGIPYQDHAGTTKIAVDAVAQQTLAEGRSPWKVILANPRLLALIMAVQSNAIIVGVEFSLPGNLLGIQSFCKLMGYYSESSADYQVEAQHLSVSDRFGRRICLYTVIFFTVTGVIIEVVATDWKQWLGSKIVVGYATGIMQSAVPTYVSEVSPREIRGIMLSFFNMAIGGLFATVVPWATTKAYPDVNDHRSFRIPLYIAVTLPVITLIAEFFLLVESPYWLMMRGRAADARKSIRFMYPKVSDEEIDMTVAQLAYTLEKEAEEAELVRKTKLDHVVDESDEITLAGFLFAGLGVVCIILVWFFIPDFTGRSYAQIDELFSRKIPARKFASTQCTGDYGRDVTDGDVEVLTTAA